MSEKYTRTYRGKFDGKSITDYYLEAEDKYITSVEKRITRVSEILNLDEDGFAQDEYLKQIWNVENGTELNVHPNTNCQLWNESNVAIGLEKLADFILYEDEVEQKIYERDELTKKIRKDGQFYMTKGEVLEVGENGELILVHKKSDNYKKAIKHKVKPSDSEKYPYLKGFDTTISDCQWLLDKEHKEEFYKKLKEINSKSSQHISEKKYKSILSNTIKSCRDNKLLYKLSVERPIIFKAPLKDSGCPTWDEFDFFDEEQVFALLNVHKEVDLQDDLYCILRDLDDLIERTPMTDRQREILYMYRFENMSVTEIGIELKITHQAISSALRSIVKILIKRYELEYSYWYYLNISKGEYKRCKKCGQVKLTSEFAKESKGHLGVKSRCNCCRQNSIK